MRGLSLLLPTLSLLAACANVPVRQPGETQVACIHRLYDYPARSAPFPTAVSACHGDGPADLTGDPYYQLLASSLNVPYTTRDPKRDGTLIVTGSRIPQPTNEPAPPTLDLR